MRVTRREFIKSAALTVPVISLAPGLLGNVVRAAGAATAVPRRTLIVVQLAGGNDGLNTLVPYADRRYYDYRSDIAISAGEVLKLDDAVGLHPSLAELKALWDESRLAIVEGVGYPEPNYSHFATMDIWRHASLAGQLQGGWLGRYFESRAAAAPSVFQGLAVSRVMPGELASPTVSIPIVENADIYQFQADAEHPQAFTGRMESLRAGYLAVPAATNHATLFQDTLGVAVRSSAQLASAVADYQPGAVYPDTPLAHGLQLLAAAITGDLGLEVGHVSLGGFDTHADQMEPHAILLTTLSQALRAFDLDLRAHGKDDNVVIMTWSEFGRRVRSNASAGTDHGAAGLMLLMGTPVKGGLYGERPDLGNLDRDNLRFTTDFRSVYASVMEDWLGVSSASILGTEYPRLGLIV